MFIRDDLEFKKVEVRGNPLSWNVLFRQRPLATLAERSSPASGYIVKLRGIANQIVCPDVKSAVETILHAINN